ncbi:MAG TPA: DNA methyltransferase, partial [Dehalococcoidia bacterium]|nr:DNA methyltransferase [Dehalococcoidia bacterium]
MSHRNLALLRQRDESWDFRGEPTKTATHGLHGYPAMMIPQVAGRLIDEFTQPGDVILDPFCGSGSVLVEAGLRGRSAWGIDLNPLAVLIARVKTTPLDTTGLRRRLDQILADARARRASPPPPPPIANLDYWFKPEVVGDLSLLRELVFDLLSTGERAFFQVALSATVRESSNT